MLNQIGYYSAERMEGACHNLMTSARKSYVLATPGNLHK